MPRRPRVLIEGGLYHVFNRVARGEEVFADVREARQFLDFIGETKRRDGLIIYAWCLLPNEYHLAVRTGMISLSRSMRTIQHRFAQSYNREHGELGPFWQGRYKTMLMPDQKDFRQLLAYVHLRPLAAGLAERADGYRFSGHREIMGRRKASLIDVGEVLAAFAEQAPTARRRYTSLLGKSRRLDWIGADPGWLPWWRIGRPAGDRPPADIDPRQAQKQRPAVDVYHLVEVCAEELGIARELLESRLKSRDIVRARELLAVIAVEQYGVKVKELGRVLNKAPESVSRWLSIALRRRVKDQELRRQIDELSTAVDRGLAE